MGANMNDQQKLTGFVEFFYQYLVDYLCWHASYQYCGKVLLALVKLLYSSKKVKLL